MKIVVAGHWHRPTAGDVYSVLAAGNQTLDGVGCEDQQRADRHLDVAPSSVEALEAVCAGVRQSVADAEVVPLLFGAGVDFVASVEGASGVVGCVPFSVPDDCDDAYELGVAVSAAVASGAQVVLEAGHAWAVSLWESFVEGAIGRVKGSLCSAAEEDVVSALRQLRQLWGALVPVMAVSTQRPFVGLSSALAVSPDLQVRVGVDADYAPSVRGVFERAYAHNCPTLGVDVVSLSPVTVAGSGAGGGIAAVLIALGGRVVDVGQFLSAAVGFPGVLSGCDLVVVLEPELHSPVLAQSQLDAVTSAAGEWALPVVAVGVDSSLSRHECAQWGLHGVMLAADNVQALTNIGVRLGHTWARRLSRR